MNPIPLLAALFGAIKEAFGFGNKITDLKNTPEMKQRDEAQKEINKDDEDEKNIAKRDLDAIRRSAS
jgi:hypothetical protein